MAIELDGIDNNLSEHFSNCFDIEDTSAEIILYKKEAK